MFLRTLAKVFILVSVSVPQGIAELGALGLDYALDTNTSRTVTEAFEAIKPQDMGTAGEVTEDLVAFGVGFIPIAGWLGRAGQAAKLAKVGKPMSTAGRGKFTTSAINFGTSKTGQEGPWHLGRVDWCYSGSNRCV